jgi:hypothetical protein
MSELFIWFNRTKIPEGYPLKDDFILKDSFKKDKPKDIPTQQWKLYNPFKMEFPPVDGYKFPSEMYMVITKASYKTIFFDYYGYSNNVAFVSDKFLAFLQKNGLDDSYYEKAKLLVIDLGGNLLTTVDYWALRFGKFDDQSFDFHPETKKRVAGIKNYFLYPEMDTVKTTFSKSVYYLSEFCYNTSLVFNKYAKDEIIGNFYSPEIYKASDFPYVYNNQYKWDILAYDNEFLVKN